MVTMLRAEEREERRYLAGRRRHHAGVVAHHAPVRLRHGVLPAHAAGLSLRRGGGQRQQRLPAAGAVGGQGELGAGQGHRHLEEDDEEESTGMMRRESVCVCVRVRACLRSQVFFMMTQLV